LAQVLAQERVTVLISIHSIAYQKIPQVLPASSWKRA